MATLCCTWISSVAISPGQGFNSLHWSTCSRARGPDSATCAGLAHGRDYIDCRALDQSHKSAWPSFFLELSKILELRRSR